MNLTEPKQMKCRIVSRSKYLVHLAGKTALGSVSVLLGMGGILFCFLALDCAAHGYSRYKTDYQVDTYFIDEWIARMCVWGSIGGILLRGASVSRKARQEIEPVLPPTRRTLVQLPAEETLLRASEESPEEPERVLLRATMSSMDTPPEQLLRPTDAAAEPTGIP